MSQIVMPLEENVDAIANEDRIISHPLLQSGTILIRALA
jgi:hypothetical protein